MKLIPGIVVLLLLPLLAACGRPAARDSEFTIVTSFYPMYIMAKNIARDIPGVRVVNLTANHAGCLHDYQLTPADMQTLAIADVLIINGGGMEPFLDKIILQEPELRIINPNLWANTASRHDLPNEPETVAHRAPDTHDITTTSTLAINTSLPFWADTAVVTLTPLTLQSDPHYWVAPGEYRRQLAEITAQLAARDPDRSTAYHANAAAYDQRLTTLQAVFLSLTVTPPQEFIIVHSTLFWLSHELSWQWRAFTFRNPETGPNVRELEQLIIRIRNKRITRLIVDTPFPPRVAETIARETGVRIYTIDPCVTGPDDPDAYLQAMERNLEVLKEALR